LLNAQASLDCNPIYASHVSGMVCMYSVPSHNLRQGLMNFLPRLASNFHPPNLPPPYPQKQAGAMVPSLCPIFWFLSCPLCALRSGFLRTALPSQHAMSIIFLIRCSDKWFWIPTEPLFQLWVGLFSLQCTSHKAMASRFCLQIPVKIVPRFVNSSLSYTSDLSSNRNASSCLSIHLGKRKKKKKKPKPWFTHNKNWNHKILKIDSFCLRSKKP
jgi:hypothetical protein